MNNFFSTYSKDFTKEKLFSFNFIFVQCSCWCWWLVFFSFTSIFFFFIIDLFSFIFSEKPQKYWFYDIKKSLRLPSFFFWDVTFDCLNLLLIFFLWTNEFCQCLFCTPSSPMYLVWLLLLVLVFNYSVDFSFYNFLSLSLFFIQTRTTYMFKKDLIYFSVKLCTVYFLYLGEIRMNGSLNIPSVYEEICLLVLK